MKNRLLIPVAVIALLMVPACERKSSEAAKQLEELQRKASDAVDRQRELERQLEDQKLATERESVERDRMQIENDREELARQQNDASADKAEEVRKREQALAGREGRLEQLQASIEEKQSDLSERGAKLNDQERELAGREALPFQSNESQEPVGDYGMFYDQLSSYGSWFETPNYGYVWQPVAVRDSNWRPYSRGSWICSDRGWTWVSDEPFGWATYHYGRWALVRGRGWVWAPGSEWAPCWVSWRENGNHIGWAPLPPETLAYRNARWDSSVDTQFGIGASWFNFVEISHFGSPLYQYCLPTSNNISFFQQTTNITYIHIENRQVICGGPRYKDVCDRIGRPIPFCRLEIDRHPRTGGSVIGLRPQIKGDRLLVSAPNMNAGWNEGMKPQRIRGRMDTMELDRNEPLRPEIADRFKKNREENLRIAGRSIQEMGGTEQFIQRRTERLEQNRKLGEAQISNPENPRNSAKSADSSLRPNDLREMEKPVVRVPVDSPVVGRNSNSQEDPPQVNDPQPQEREISEGRLRSRPETNRPAPAGELPRGETRVRSNEPQEQAQKPELPPQPAAQQSISEREMEKVNRLQRSKGQEKQTTDEPRETVLQSQRERVKPQERLPEQMENQQAEHVREAQKQAMEQQQERSRQQQERAQQQQERARQELEKQQAEQVRESQKEAIQQQERSRQQQERAQQQQERARHELENQRAEQAREAQKEAMQQQQQQQQQEARQREQKEAQDQNQEQKHRRNQ